ncbi:MAG: M23 family metallopeptidase, partial [Actinomycetota bacterium]|nr:M23 family metallopeptidase [Actinomycetota bacterium]
AFAAGFRPQADARSPCMPAKPTARAVALTTTLAALVAGALTGPLASAQERRAPVLPGLAPAPGPTLLEGLPGGSWSVVAQREQAERERLERERARVRKREARERARKAMRFPLDARGGVDFGEAGARFGNNRGSHSHQGQDVFAPAGTPLVAASEAEVVAAGNEGDGRGNHVALHDERRDRTYVYFHMSEAPRVGVGEKVVAGQRVGSVGCTGSCSGAHLHFEIRRGEGTDGQALDPLGAMRGWPRG